MSGNLPTHATAFAGATFASTGITVAIALALLSTWVVVVVLAYLNQYTHQSYFRFWAVAWLCFSLYLAASIALEQLPGVTLLVTLSCACVGISALCMVWGSLHLAGRAHRRRYLGLGLLVILVWSFAAPHFARNPIWVETPAFVLLALASAFTADVYLRHCKEHKGGRLLVNGLLLWSLQMIAFPWGMSLSPAFRSLGYGALAVLALCMALGMIMVALDQARARNDALLGEFKKGVAQRRLLEQEVNVSEEKYRLLFDSAGDAIFLVDLGSLRIIEANPAAAALAGFDPGQLVGRLLADLCPTVRSPGESLLENKKGVEDLFDAAGEFQLVKAQGERVLCEGSATLVDSQRQPVLQINAREITGRKKLEQQLRQSEKLSALGQLVAGVAHELNNPLAVVMGYAQLLAKHKALDDKVRKDLHKVLHESERAAKIVSNLLTFVRPREPHLGMVDVNRLVTEALETREIQMQSANVKVVRRLTADLPETMADAGQIEQVLTNLVANAIHALAGCPDPRIIEVATERRGDRIRIVVADNGPGIPMQIIDKIFDPFFTTKGPGKGTGLGLSICYSIMEEHKGRIWVDSEVGKGTRFIAELPVTKCPDAPDEKRDDGDAGELAPAPRQRRLLIVDDEPGIVDVLAEALNGIGYQADTASNGAEALKQIASQDYDLIISDLCMPEMTGEELYAAISQHHPHLQNRIVFVTGDTVSPASRRFLEQSCVRWLTKPFELSEIERLVASSLSGELAETVHARDDSQAAPSAV
jgi:PAS domain S-box-containing protein